MTMHIAIDGFNIAMPRGTGVATYGRMLAKTLAGAGHTVDGIFGLTINRASPELLREVQFFDGLAKEEGRRAPVIGSERWFSELSLRFRPIEAATIPLSGRVETRGFANRLPVFDRVLNAADLFDVAHRHFRATGKFLRLRVPGAVPQIMHWTYPLPLLLEGARNVYTLHDLVPLRLPYTTLDNKRSYLRLLHGCVQHADHLCTVSESSRRDIIDMLNVAPDRVTNTYQTSELPATPTETAGAAEFAAWLNGLFGLEPNKYLLFYGALEPKKNIGRIVEACLSVQLPMPLVIVGGRAWKSESELRLLQAGPDGVRNKRMRGAVRQLEYVPASWLSGLVRGARAVVFPSLAEGFGLPVLEALQQGIPVLTSYEGSLPEVGGDAVLLADAYDAAAIGAAMQRLATDDELHRRLSLAGPAQAERFSPVAYTARLNELYATILARPPRTFHAS